MVTSLKKWCREFIDEAPWYFWAYAALTPLGFLLNDKKESVILATVSLAIYPFLLKFQGLLKSKIFYIFSIFLYIITEIWTIKFFIGQNLHLYFCELYGSTDYPRMYTFLITLCVVCVLSGMPLPEHREDNIKTFCPFTPFNSSERTTAETALAAYRNSGVLLTRLSAV